jgi:cellulose synthase/poly-beta-1,6-N-acetylglucosamine synthase-like glycosyltransferase
MNIDKNKQNTLYIDAKSIKIKDLVNTDFSNKTVNVFKDEIFTDNLNITKEKKLFKTPEILRKVSILLLSFGVISFLTWRLLFTFNPQYPLYSSFFLFADFITGFSTIGFAISIWNLDSNNTEPPSIVGNPTVDVFIPTYNENIDILTRTISSCIDMNYPHQTYVLDDGNRPEVKELTEKLGAKYINRADNKNAKAGNFNNALKHTNSDFIASFDADFIPQKDFLEKLLGYFNDPKVALVQSPQYYYNINSFQHKRLYQRIWNEQNTFFDLILNGRNHWNSSFWIGTNAIVRRKAIEQIGGISYESVIEDMLTTMRLHSNKWKTVYVNKPYAYGLAPSNIRQFLIQRKRWAEGAMQIMLFNNPLFTKGLTFMQKLNYFSSLLHFMEGFPRTIYYTLPAIYLLTGICPIILNKTGILIIISYVVLNYFMIKIASKNKVFFYYDELYGMLRFYTYLTGALKVFLKNSNKFSVTPKDDKLSNIKYFIIGPALIFCLNTSALFSKNFLLFHGGLNSIIYLFSLLLCCFFSILSLQALYTCFTFPEYDSFFIHDPIFLNINYENNDISYTEKSITKSWNDSRAIFISKFSYPEKSSLKISFSYNNIYISDLSAEIYSKNEVSFYNNTKLYEYEISFKNINFSDKVNIIKALFRDGVSKQLIHLYYFNNYNFFPLNIHHNNKDKLVFGNIIDKNNLIINVEEEFLYSNDIYVFLNKNEKILFNIHSNIKYRGSNYLIIKTNHDINLLKEFKSSKKSNLNRNVLKQKLLFTTSSFILLSIFFSNTSIYNGIFLENIKNELFESHKHIKNNVENSVHKYKNLKVIGANLCSQDNSPIRLKGLSSHGLQWFPFTKGKTVQNSVNFFNIDVLRVAMYVEAFKDGNFWNGYLAQKDYMVNQTDSIIKDAIENDIYVILSWHIHGDPNDYSKEAGNFFKKMSNKWGSYPNIIFEICNEPEGNISWSKIKQYAIGNPKNTEDGIIDIIRKNDSDKNPNIIIVGTPFWSQRVDKVLGDPITEYDNIMYSMHFYAGSHYDNVRKYAEIAAQKKLPIFVTEWGTSIHLGNGSMDFKNSEKWIKWMDKYNISWINWSLSICDEMASVLKPNVSIDGPWKENDLSISGKFVKRMIDNNAKIK